MAPHSGALLSASGLEEAEVLMAASLPVILHIPHGGYQIPDEYRHLLLLDDTALQHEMGLMTDHGTDTLFMSLDAPVERQISPWSRLFVDMERFPDDSQESMSKKGMGVFYERTSAGSLLRERMCGELRKQLMKEFYEPYHLELTQKVDALLALAGHCLIVDCHSFPREPLPYEDPALERPEICLGSDAFHTRPELLTHFQQVFEAAGFEVGINAPFAGSLVPLKHYGQNAQVQSIMIEVRRDLYIRSVSMPEIDYDTVAVHQIRELASQAIHGAIACLV